MPAQKVSLWQNPRSWSVGGTMRAACLLNGTVVCWGNNSYKQTNVPTVEPFVKVAPGKCHTCDQWDCPVLGKHHH